MGKATSIILFASLAGTTLAAKVADHSNFLGYEPNTAVTSAAVACYAGVATTMLILMIRGRWPARYMLPMIIGAYVMAMGLTLRFVLRNNPGSLPLYATENLMIVLSPCGFIATNYMVLGRLARHLGHGDYLFISPMRVTRFFVLSDVSTFLIQATGGAISTGNSHSAATLGSNLFVVGLGIQLGSYLLFTCLYLTFLYRVRSKSPETWNASGHNKEQSPDERPRDWRFFAFAIFVSSVGVIVRSVFRVIEGTQGYFGPLASNQAAFFLLDSLPLFIAVAIYIPFWPGQYIDTNSLREEQRALEEHAKSPEDVGIPYS